MSFCNVFCIFEENYIFVENLDISFQSYQRISWNCNDKIWVGDEGLRDEKNKYPVYRNMWT